MNDQDYCMCTQTIKVHLQGVGFRCWMHAWGQRPFSPPLLAPHGMLMTWWVLLACKCIWCCLGWGRACMCQSLVGPSFIAVCDTGSKVFIHAGTCLSPAIDASLQLGEGIMELHKLLAGKQGSSRGLHPGISQPRGYTLFSLVPVSRTCKYDQNVREF